MHVWLWVCSLLRARESQTRDDTALAVTRLRPCVPRGVPRCPGDTGTPTPRQAIATLRKAIGVDVVTP